MSYKGLEMTSQEDYIFSGTIPYNPEFDMEQLKTIENKLISFSLGKSTDGITAEEAEIFLDWVTFNSRNYAVRNIPESPVTASMTGQCAPTQCINFKLLSKMGLDVKAFNTGDCIGDIPINDEDFRRIQNGFGSPAVRHSISLVNIPIIDNNGSTQNYKFLLDPTFRQFCKKENCNYNKFVDRESMSHGHVAPDPGYFMQSNNLQQLGVSQDVAEKSEMLGKYIVSKGYFYLNEENAKLYGDAFVRASTRLEFQHMPIEMTGIDYIRNFENNPMQILDFDKDNYKYTMTPSEIDQPKKQKGFFSKILNFFKDKFKSNEPLALEAGISHTPTERKILESVQLSEEELNAYRHGEKEVLDSYYGKEKSTVDNKEEISNENDGIEL